MQEHFPGELGYLMRWTYNKSKSQVQWEQVEYRNKIKVTPRIGIPAGVSYTLYLVQAESR
jgi:hypothetical protein